jgi:hypothetical protein
MWVKVVKTGSNRCKRHEPAAVLAWGAGHSQRDKISLNIDFFGIPELQIYDYILCLLFCAQIAFFSAGNSRQASGDDGEYRELKKGALLL